MASRGGTKCAFYDCSSKTGEGVSLFCFPNDSQRANLWIRACNREDLVDKTCEALSKNYRLCEKHFEDQCFVGSGKKRKHLAHDAVPTLFAHHDHDEPKRKIRILSDITLPTKEHRDASTYPQHLESPVPDKVLESTFQNVFEQSHKTLSRSESPVPGPSGMHIFIDASTACDPPPILSPVSTQTPHTMTSMTPRKIKLRKKMRNLRKSTSTKKKGPEGGLEWSIESFYHMCDEFLGNKALADIVKLQSILKDKKPKGRRYSEEFKQFALTLYFLGPRAYAFMQKLMYLPTKRTLEKMTADIIHSPGLQNGAVFQSIQTKSKTMLEQEKHCILCIDEMSIKANLFYHTGRDEVVGLHDVGTGEKEFLFAQNALVIMARGLYSNWKQPLAYFFVHTQFDARQLKVVLDECIRKVLICGLQVDAVVSDLGSNFINLANILNVTPDNPQFEVDGKSIIYLFDTCHLIKATRNNLIQNTLCFNNKKTSWRFVEEFYNRDKSQSYRIAPKLTDSHIHPTNFEKMKVKLATQVLSHSVASGMNTYVSLGAISGEALGTIEVIEKFDRLFDLLNSSNKDVINPLKSVFVGNDSQMGYLDEMVDFIANMKIFNKNGKDVTSASKFKPGWIITINGLKKLWLQLAAVNFKYLKTRRINQDVVENFFGSIRQQGGNSVNPTPIQFERAFRKLFCQSFLHSTGMNCIEDEDTLLATIRQADFKKIHCKENRQFEDKAIKLPDYDYKNEDILTQNPFVYVCGYLLKKALKIESCDICTNFSKESEELDTNKLFIYFKAYDRDRSTFGGLRVPSEQFINFVYNMEKIFSTQFQEICRGRGISRNLLQKVMDLEFSHPCERFPIDYVRKLFIRMKIFYAVKYANRDLKSDKLAKKKNIKISILSHL